MPAEILASNSDLVMIWLTHSVGRPVGDIDMAIVRCLQRWRACYLTLIDNLNASIDGRALLTDIFLIDEVLAADLRSVSRRT